MALEKWLPRREAGTVLLEKRAALGVGTTCLNLKSKGFLLCFYNFACIGSSFPPGKTMTSNACPRETQADLDEQGSGL